MASSGGKPPEPPSVGGYFTTMFGLPAKGQAPATASTAGVKAADTNPEDIPKEDLLHLCMKMNKRMQALEAKGAEMNKKCKDLGTEKRQLLDIIKSYVNGDVSTDADALDMVALREKVSRQSALTKDAIKSLEDRLTLSERAHAKELAALELKMHKELSLQASKVANASHINPSDGSVENGGMSSIQNDYFAMEIERLAAENEAMSSLKEDLQSKLVNCDSEIAANREKVEQLVREVSQLELVAREKATHLDEFMKESDREKMKAEERILYLQMQLNALKSKEEGKDKEITVLKAENEEQTASILALQNQVKDGEININDYKEVIRDLHSKVSDFEEEMSRLKGKGHELEKNSAYTTVLKAEQEAIVSTLRKDLKIAISGREESVRRCRELEEYRVKAEAKLGQLSEMIQAVDEARDALEEREARITRLQSEATTAERNHAIRTAMLATAESHIESLKSDIESRDKSLREVSQRCEALQAQIDEADGRMTKAVDDLKVELHRAIATLKEDSIAHTMELASIKEKHAEELDHIKRDYTKKSTAARVMMSEKDAEIKTLTALVAELKDEIASGAHNERRIFELAKSQSQREATHNLHR